MRILKDYDRNDNDTYVEVLSKNMVIDVELHMHRDPDAHVRSGNIHGHFSVESRLRAENNVLHFPKASDTSLIRITDKKIKTLVPMSLVSRYELNESQLTFAQKTPIFYDNKINKFVVLLDYRFLRDIKLHELNLETKHYKTYHDKKQKDVIYFGLTFDSMSDVEEQCSTGTIKDGVLFDVMESYKFYKMSLQGGEKVIIVNFLNSENEQTKLFDFSLNKYLENCITARSFDIEYAVAVRFEKRYYFVDKNGQIIQSSAFYLDKEKQQTKDDGNDEIRSMGFSVGKKKHSVFVCPYTDEQFNLIEALSKKMNDIQTEFANLFKNASNSSEKLDSPITSLPSNGFIKLIENKS
jgi:hypothetical protein